MDCQPSVINFSLEGVPERERRATLTEVFGRGVINMDFQPLDERPTFDFEIRLFPEVVVTRGYNSPHVAASAHDRSRENDDLMFAWVREPAHGSVLQRGKELPADGTGALLTCADKMVGSTLSGFHFLNIRLSRRKLAQLLPNPEDHLLRPIPPSAEALRLLKTYLEIVRTNADTCSPEVAQAVSLHIADLIALAVGTGRDESQVAGRRGLRAARSASVKAWLLERLSDPNLSVGAVAAAHAISPRYVQLLFEYEGTSFSAWLRGQRLALARRRLADPAFDHRSIACIAFDCGFSDLSWFNHAFRAAYGMTPSDVRHGEARNTRH